MKLIYLIILLLFSFTVKANKDLSEPKLQKNNSTIKLKINSPNTISFKSIILKIKSFTMKQKMILSAIGVLIVALGGWMTFNRKSSKASRNNAGNNQGACASDFKQQGGGGKQNSGFQRQSDGNKQTGTGTVSDDTGTGGGSKNTSENGLSVSKITRTINFAPSTTVHDDSGEENKSNLSPKSSEVQKKLNFSDHQNGVEGQEDNNIDDTDQNGNILTPTKAKENTPTKAEENAHIRFESMNNNNTSKSPQTIHIACSSCLSCSEKKKKKTSLDQLNEENA